MVNRFSNRVLIIDGQGGNMGRQLVEQLLLQSSITLVTAQLISVPNICSRHFSPLYFFQR